MRNTEESGIYNLWKFWNVSDFHKGFWGFFYIFVKKMYNNCITLLYNTLYNGSGGKYV